MTAVTRTKQRWDTLEYHQIVWASCQDGELTVRFADGSEVRVPPQSLLPPGAAAPDWSRLRNEVIHMVVPSPTGDVEIPWDVIRRQSDPEFEAFWAELAAESARRIGNRIRGLREVERLSRAQLAERANIPLDLLTEIEAGRESATLTELDQLLSALGAAPDALTDGSGADRT